jgi:hypothetical protein
MSESAKNRIVSDETRKKMSISMMGKNYGRKISEENRKNMSKAQSGENNANYGIIWTEERKQKSSKTQRGTKKNMITSSTYIGVSWGTSGAWVSSISYKGRKKYIGLYLTEENAAIAYDQESIKLYEEDAKLNFDPEFVKNITVEKINRRKKRKSNYIGIVAHGDKWRSRIRVNKKIYELGIYATEIEAAKAYDLKAIELRGANTKVNFPLSI